MIRLRTELKLLQINRRLIHHNVALLQRRRIVGDLRANIEDAADHVGERAALAQLGDPDDLAADFTSPAEHRRPTVRTGVLAVIWALAGLATLSLVRIPTFGTIEVFDSHTGDTTWHIQLWRLGEMSGDATQDTLFEATVYSYGFLLAMAIAFAIGARLWRLRTRTSHRPSVESRRPIDIPRTAATRPGGPRAG